MSDPPLRKELKEKFLRDLNPSERVYFLKKAKEAVAEKGYRASEDLFHYCYYLTVMERFRGITPERDDGMLRFLLVEGKKDIEEAIKSHEARLEEAKSPLPGEMEMKFIEYFSE
ncbi:MAG: hypothetical protein AB1442_03375 [Nitrospirota bacterium]